MHIVTCPTRTHTPTPTLIHTRPQCRPFHNPFSFAFPFRILFSYLFVVSYRISHAGRLLLSLLLSLLLFFVVVIFVQFLLQLANVIESDLKIIFTFDFICFFFQLVGCSFSITVLTTNYVNPLGTFVRFCFCVCCCSCWCLLFFSCMANWRHMQCAFRLLGTKRMENILLLQIVGEQSFVFFCSKCKLLWENNPLLLFMKICCRN